MPRHTEPSVNNALGGLLDGMLSRGEVRSENTRAIAGRPGLRPDILISALGRSPVAVEAEYVPALTVEGEARSRLGLVLASSRRRIEAAIAVRYPEEVGDAPDLADALRAARLSYCVFTDESDGVKRFPASGWLDGTVEDVADLVHLSSLPQRAVEKAAAEFEDGIEAASCMLDETDKLRPAVTASIARQLGMANVTQTRRMACAIIANAMVFHERIAGTHTQVPPLAMVCGPASPNPLGDTLQAWTEILDVNYWPIFAIAKDVLQQMPSGDAARILRGLHDTAVRVNVTGVENSHDLTGRIFQRLIADRKYLATFYTLPASAALLARLAVAQLEDDVDWSDADAIGRLRVADFACGTGALLSAVYEQIASRHERAGGDPAALHRMMLEEVLYGCDVMPSAIHITGSTLSGVEPAIGFGRSRLYTFAYGRQSDGSVKIGSLELLQSSAAMTLFNTSDPALRTTGVREEAAAYVVADIPDEGFDLVIMNPPFTSDTKHRDSREGVHAAAFAAFDATAEEQDAMATRLRQSARDSCYHGHAGLGSAFAALAHLKLRPGGVAAFVLPFTAINGASWAKFRELIATQYAEVTIVSIASSGREMSFSSDTGMAECLVIARKASGREKPAGRAKFVSLMRRPASFVAAAEYGKRILGDLTVRRLEDGPYGGIPINFGNADEGEVLDAPLGEYLNGWGAARILDATTAQVAHSLTRGKLSLPAEPGPFELPVTNLNQIGQRGLDSQLLISKAHRGPFTRGPSSPTATYPSLWNHDAENETRLVCEPDSQLRVLPEMESRAAEIWSTASRAHLNRDFTFGSQALAVAFTDAESLGGRIWPNVTFSDTRFDYVFSVWGNSTLGLLAYWWHSSRQQSSKAGMTIRSAESLPVLDFRALSDGQLAVAEEIFGDFRGRELLPAYLADADANRALLDRRVVCDLLGFDVNVYRAVRRLAAKWCAEPSVHGGKSRPECVAPVVDV